MQIIEILKIIGKNIIIFIGGAIFGIIIVLIFIFPRAIEGVSNKEPLAGLVLAPLLLIIYGSLSIAVGGFGAVIIYNIVKAVKRKILIRTGVNK